MHSIQTQGLLLQSIPYLGKKKLLRVLSQEHGLITLFSQKETLAPFCFAEWVYRASLRDIHPLQEASLIDPLSDLRKCYTTLTAAGHIAQTLLATQFPAKPAPLALSLAFLRKLPLNPTLLSAAFHVKLLLHEGLFSPSALFTDSEWETVQAIACAKEFSTLLKMENAPLQKITTYFESLIDTM